MDIKIINKNLEEEKLYFCENTNINIDVYNSLKNFESYVIHNNIFVSIFQTKFKKENKEILFFGHLNLPKTDISYSKLVEFLKSFVVNSSHTLIGPIDGNTHNNYRFCTKGINDFNFSGEYILDYNLYKYMIDCGFKTFSTYYSTLNTDLDKLNPRVKKIRNRLENKGMKFINFEMQYLEDIYKISVDAFKNNLFYTEPSYEEFYHFVKKNEVLINPKLFKLVEFKGEIIAFSFCYHNYLDETNTSFVGKTIAVKSKYQKLAIGRVLAEEMLISGKELGYNSIINAYMHEDNESYRSSLFYSNKKKVYELIYWEQND